MKCKFCNAEIEQEATVCPYCGKELSEATPEEETTVETETAVQNEEKPPKKKDPLKIVLVVVAIALAVAILAVCIGAALYAFRKDSFQGQGDGVTFKGDYTLTVPDKQTADAVVAMAGEETLTNSQLQFYYWYYVNNFYSYYGSILGLMGLDTTMPLSEQIQNQETGQTWQQYFLENALESWYRSSAVVLLGKADGFKLDEETKATIDGMAQQLEEMAGLYGFENAQALIQADFGKLSDMDGYLRYMQTNLYSNGYYNSLYDTLIPTQEEVESYYAQNKEELDERMGEEAMKKYIDVRHILLTPEGEVQEDGTYTDAQWEACRAAAQKLLDEFLAGKATEEEFGELANKNSTDPGSNTNGGLYQQVAQGQMVEPFDTWCFAVDRKEGDTGLVKTDFGYHLMYFVGSQDAWYVVAQSDLINQRTDELIDKAKERWPITVDYSKIALGEIPTTEPAE